MLVSAKDIPSNIVRVLESHSGFIFCEAPAKELSIGVFVVKRSECVDEMRTFVDECKLFRRERTGAPIR